MDPQALFRAWCARTTAYDVVRVAAAVVLLTAAGLKAHQAATSPVLGDGFLDSRWVLIATVEFEIFFGIWLLSNILPVWTRRAAIALFTLFAAVSLYKALTGHASCGCFGRVEVNPWWTSGFDGVVLLALLRCFPKRQSCGLSLPRVLTVALLLVFIGIPVACDTSGPLDTIDDEFSSLGRVFNSPNGRLGIFLEPETWVGRRLPLLDHLAFEDAPQPLREKLFDGRWNVLLVHSGCKACQRLSAKLKDEEAVLALGFDPKARIAVIELPERPVTDLQIVPASEGGSNQANICLGRLRPDKEWYCPTPFLVKTDSAKVVACREPSDLAGFGKR